MSIRGTSVHAWVMLAVVCVALSSAASAQQEVPLGGSFEGFEEFEPRDDDYARHFSMVLELVLNGEDVLWERSQVAPVEVLFPPMDPSGRTARPPDAETPEALVCPADVDGQKVRVAGGGDSYGPLANAPVWEVEAPFLLWEGTPVEEFSVVLIDDFDFEALTDAQIDDTDRFDGAGRHGNLVLHHTLRLLAADHAFGPFELEEGGDAVADIDATPGSVGYRELRFETAAGADVRIGLVDFDFETPRLGRAVAMSMERVPPTGNVAYNMSWNLVPCHLYDMYFESFYDPDTPLPAYASYADFLRAIAEANHDADVFVRLYEAFVTIVPGGDQVDPVEFVEHVINAVATDQAFEVVPIVEPVGAWWAAAGNQGLGFSLPPGAPLPGLQWPILAAGSCEFWSASNGDPEPESRRAPWSNHGGGVPLALGAWFKAPWSDEEEPSWYAGTSFSSPVFALAAAARLEDPSEWLGCRNE